jgi:hypothetical protein
LIKEIKEIRNTPVERCRGCVRNAVGKFGLFYEFNSDEGWSPRELIIDVDKLGKILLANPRPVQYENAGNPCMMDMVVRHEIFPEHLAHVDMREPPYVGEFAFTEDSTGESRLFHICTDGHHRLLRALREGHTEVGFYLFTQEEMLSAAYYDIRAYMAARGIFMFLL